MKKDKLHLKAFENWINDPNGFIYFKGMYHMFYQCFPYAPRWGTMHWGHAVSPDLLNWEHKKIALFPTRYEDQNGCFSGSAVEDQGILHLFYTGVHYNQADPKDIHMCQNEQFESTQMELVSEDGVHFDNYASKRVVIPVLDDEKTGDRTHTRDPKVWRGKNGWYMVLGTTAGRKNGKLLIFRSKDLSGWELLGSAAGADDCGWMWECPDYFETEGGNVLLVSAMGICRGRDREENQTICFPADFREENGRMEIGDSYQFFDYGFDLYAPQSTTDEDGRRVIVAWLRMPEPVDGSWNGMFCLPRVAEVRNGHIYFRVHPNIRNAFCKKISRIDEADEAGCLIRFSLNEGEEADIGGYRIKREGNHLCADRRDVFPENGRGDRHFKTPEVNDGWQIEVFAERNMIEVYVNDGEYVISNAVYGLKQELKLPEDCKAEIYTVCGEL